MPQPVQSPQQPYPPQLLGHDDQGTPYYQQQGGIAEAIANAVYMLGRLWGPKSLTQQDARTAQGVNGADPQSTNLGQQL